MNEAIVLLQNPPVWSDEAIQFLNYKHISVDEAILSLQNPSVLSYEAIMPLLKFVKRSADTIGRSVSVSEYRTVGTSPTFELQYEFYEKLTFVNEYC